MLEKNIMPEIINTYIIPTLNNYKGLKRLLETLEKYTEQNYRVIVIHNGFTFDSPDKDLIPEIKKKTHLWIDSYKNLGFAKSMNTGIRIADTPFITCANDDVEILYQGWWDEIMNNFKERPQLMGFNPHSPCNKMHTGDRVIEYPYKEEYNEDDIRKMKEFFTGQKFYIGCCTYFTIFKRQLFQEIGLFDESFGQGSGEDYDLMVRAAKKDYVIAGGSSTMVFHWWGATKDNMPKTADGSISNYALIDIGNQNMERKWGKHIDKDPNGWTVGGKGGPDEPFDKEKIKYPQDKWYQIVPL